MTTESDILARWREHSSALVQDIEQKRRQIAELKAENERLRSAIPPKRFPIMGGPSLPWEMIAPYERQAKRNYDQSLKRLAERGGLSCAEAMAVFACLDGSAARNLDEQIEQESKARLESLLETWESSRRSEDANPDELTSFDVDGCEVHPCGSICRDCFALFDDLQDEVTKAESQALRNVSPQPCIVRVTVLKARK
jgi:hypothetical protein